MSLYEQEPEVWLLRTFLSRLDHRSVIDVGAERGALAKEPVRTWTIGGGFGGTRPRSADVARDGARARKSPDHAATVNIT